MTDEFRESRIALIGIVLLTACTAAWVAGFAIWAYLTGGLR